MKKIIMYMLLILSISSNANAVGAYVEGWCTGTNLASSILQVALTTAEIAFIESWSQSVQQALQGNASAIANSLQASFGAQAASDAVSKTSKLWVDQKLKNMTREVFGIGKEESSCLNEFGYYTVKGQELADGAVAYLATNIKKFSDGLTVDKKYQDEIRRKEADKVRENFYIATGKTLTENQTNGFVSAINFMFSSYLPDPTPAGFTNKQNENRWQNEKQKLGVIREVAALPWMQYLADRIPLVPSQEINKKLASNLVLPPTTIEPSKNMGANPKVTPIPDSSEKSLSIRAVHEARNSYMQSKVFLNEKLDESGQLAKVLRALVADVDYKAKMLERMEVGNLLLSILVENGPAKDAYNNLQRAMK